MKILFVMQSPEYLRYYDSTIELLGEHGHTVALAVNRQNERKSARLEDLVARNPERISVVGLVPRREDRWYPVARGLRAIIDYVRFLHPDFANAPALRARIQRKVLPEPFHFLARVATLRASQVRLLVWILCKLERAVPTSPAVDTFVRSQQPDLVLVTPLVDAASDQVDVVKSAQSLGIRTGLCVASWDNLTNKGLVRIQPDAVFVWNEVQKREAVAFHGVPARRIAVTGAQPFDRWFGRKPSTTREEFCRKVGFERARPFVLFVGSSAFISEPHAEVEFVRKWVAAIRRHGGPALRDAPVLVRPHPYNTRVWATTEITGLGDVVVWPRGGSNPVDEDDRADYFDSLFHSAAVVGINTSAMLEAAIVGRPVHTVAGPDFDATQEGTLHFHYLLPEHGGFLRVARTLDEHVAALGRDLGADGTEAAAEIESFVASFLRPRGMDAACAPILVEEIERLGASGRTRRRRTPFWLLPARAALALLARRIARREGRLAAAGIKPKAKGRAADPPAARELAAGEGAAFSRMEAARAARQHGALRLLFFLSHFGFLRFFDPVLRELAARGHAAHLVVGRSNQQGGTEIVQRLCEECPSITFEMAPPRKSRLWLAPATWLRSGVEYCRFLRPEYRDAPRLRERGRTRAPRFVVALSRLPGLRSRLGVRAFTGALRSLEHAIPSGADVERLIAGQQPDVVVVSPLLELGSSQADHVRSARALGLRTALCVGSWDHLSSKALIRDMPELVAVWNETQKQEAIAFHGVPPERVVVTGAPVYDDWFAWQARPREEFCRRVGLPPDRPYLLWACSSLYSGPIVEPEFVLRWLAALRARPEPILRDIPVLVRPHPKRGGEWEGIDLSSRKDTVLWPPAGATPWEQESKADYFDSLYHSVAVVGLNTSALIEAGIVGREVHTILVPEFTESQQGTLHYAYLSTVNGGLVRVASCLDEHFRQLRGAIGSDDRPARDTRGFVQAFVRPHGLDVPATPALVDAIEALARQPAPEPHRGSVADRVLRLPLYAVAGATSALRWWLERRRLGKETAKTERKLNRLERLQLKEVAKAEKVRRREELIAAKRKGSDAAAPDERASKRSKVALEEARTKEKRQAGESPNAKVKEKLQEKERPKEKSKERSEEQAREKKRLEKLARKEEKKRATA